MSDVEDLVAGDWPPAPSRAPSVLGTPDPEAFTKVFNQHQDADIILSTVDGFKIPAHKWLLSRVSDLFRAMFTLPQPARVGPAAQTWSNVEGEELLVVELPDAALAVVNLLTIIYPESEGSFRFTPDEIRDALVLAEKYEIRRAIYSLKTLLQSTAILVEHPLDCYSIAVKFGYNDILSLALKELIDRNYRLSGDEHLLRLLQRGHMTSVEFWVLLRNLPCCHYH